MAIYATVIGNLGRDAEIRQAGSGNVCSFSIASTEKKKGEDATTWVRVSMWGARGEKLAPHLKKGTRVAVAGSLSTREHEGKTYVELRADQLEFLGSRNSSTQKPAAPQSTEDDAPEKTDDIPF